MRFLVILVIIALLAAGYHFSETDTLIRAGFYSGNGDKMSLVALAAIGLLGARYEGDAWVIAAVGFAGAMAAAALTSVLDLKQLNILIAVSLLAIGLVGAWGSKPHMAYIAVVAAVVGLIHGHAIVDGARSAAQAKYLAGFAMASGATILIGTAIGQWADRLSSGVSTKLSAGVAGVGAYLTARIFGLL